MNKKIKSYFAGIFVVFKLRPMTFMGAVFISGFGIINIFISVFTLSFHIGMTGVYSTILGITKFCALWQYKNIQSFENKKAVKEVEYIVAKRMAITTAVLSFLQFSTAIVMTFFHEEPIQKYELVLIVYFGAYATINLIASMINAIRTRKNHSIIMHHIKLINFAHALIALSITQRTILYYVGHEWAKAVSGAGGIIFSLAAGGVCILMFFKSRRVKRYIVNDSAKTSLSL